MQEWINFYNNIDKKTDGSLTGWILGFIIPMIVSIILMNTDNFIPHLFMEGDKSVETFTWIGWTFATFVNYASLMLVLLVLVIVVALLISIGSSVITFFIERFTGIKSFINIIKVAKSESFDSSAVEMKPKKEKLHIKE